MRSRVEISASAWGCGDQNPASRPAALRIMPGASDMSEHIRFQILLAYIWDQSSGRVPYADGSRYKNIIEGAGSMFQGQRFDWTGA